MRSPAQTFGKTHNMLNRAMMECIQNTDKKIVVVSATMQHALRLRDQFLTLCRDVGLRGAATTNALRNGVTLNGNTVNFESMSRVERPDFNHKLRGGMKVFVDHYATETSWNRAMARATQHIKSVKIVWKD